MKEKLKDTTGIKVRGRSTGLFPPKKPYRIKSKNKQQIFNFKGKDKKGLYLQILLIDH